LWYHLLVDLRMKEFQILQLAVVVVVELEKEMGMGKEMGKEMEMEMGKELGQVGLLHRASLQG